MSRTIRKHDLESQSFDHTFLRDLGIQIIDFELFVEDLDFSYQWLWAEFINVAPYAPAPGPPPPSPNPPLAKLSPPVSLPARLIYEPQRRRMRRYLSNCFSRFRINRGFVPENSINTRFATSDIHNFDIYRHLSIDWYHKSSHSCLYMTYKSLPISCVKTGM